MILDELFAFPTLVVDGDVEQSKKSLYEGSRNQPEMDVVQSEAEMPYFALIGITDRWLPTDESFDRALEHGKFDACVVTFSNIGSFLVPWTKNKFKNEYRKFVEGIVPPAEEKLQIIKLSKKDLQKITDSQDDDEENGK